MRHDGAMTSEEHLYIVTDIECDGPCPGANSMISFASVAVTAAGEEQGVFQAVLAGLPNAAPNPDTYAWFQTHPEAWAAATTDPKPPGQVMAEFVAWLQSFDQPRVFTASPIAFDGLWIDYYLRRFTSHRLVQGPYEPDRLFHGAGLCLRSHAAGVTGRSLDDCSPAALPSEWLGGIEHNHRAIDDARGYAHLLGVLMGMAGSTGG